MSDGTPPNPTLRAHECPNGHLTYPSHPVCPDCGERQTATVELTDSVGEILTWTTVSTTPPGVREPNTLALVEFVVGDRSVRMLGGTTTDDVSCGDRVRPVYSEQLRDPANSIREPESQRWDGWQFEPAEN
jgi:uncharacterized OB-fold protein